MWATKVLLVPMTPFEHVLVLHKDKEGHTRTTTGQIWTIGGTPPSRIHPHLALLKSLLSLSFLRILSTMVHVQEVSYADGVRVNFPICRKSQLFAPVRTRRKMKKEKEAEKSKEKLRKLENSDLFFDRVWGIPGFGAYQSLAQKIKVPFSKSFSFLLQF